jgi:sulfite reductase (ferredoxin)
METLRLPERVRRDVAGYRDQVECFERGEINAAAFRVFRVPMGVYEHRESGRFMVRVRLGAGLALPHQLEHIAGLAERYGDGAVHVTTRQDLQIHDVALADTVPIQESLLEVGLSARGGGGNTVRNVTACPRASVCPTAAFDVAPYALAAAEHLLQLDRSYSLPRKYKIAFSGCGEDCAFAAVNDLGFFAHVRDGRTGFSVYAGGGLGSQPAAGVQIEEFVEPDALPLIAEAIERLFDRLGDRANKNRARLRFVLRRLGAEAFVAEYRQDKAALLQEGLGGPRVAVRPLPAAVTGTGTQSAAAVAAPVGCLPERDPDRVTVVVQLQNGRLPAPDLRVVAALARTAGVGVVVATQQQDLLIIGVARARVEEARAELAKLSVPVRARVPKVVACAGASTCKLGMCLSPALAKAVEARLSDVDTHRGPTEIRISGCANSCGNHSIAGLGLEGRARRSHGRLLPLYEILWGGRVGESRATFAERLGSVPASVVPELLADIYRRGLHETGEVRALVAEYARVPEPVPESYYVDVGCTEPFSLEGRGPAECGAGVLDVVRADIDEASAALVAAEGASGLAQDQAVAKAALASGRALLPLVGKDTRSAAEVFQAVRVHLIEPGWVAPPVGQLLTAVETWTSGPRESLSGHLATARQFAARTRELFTSLDANLKFQAARLPAPSPSAFGGAGDSPRDSL